MQEMFSQLRHFTVERLPTLVVPIATLVVGWIIAMILSSITRRALERTNIDDRIADKVLGRERPTRVNTARWVGRAVFYIVLLLTLVVFFQVTKLTAASEPVNAMLAPVMVYIPLIFAAAAILFVAWLVATLVRSVLSRALEHWDVDRRLQRRSQIEARDARIEARETSLVEPVESTEITQAPKPAPVSRAIAEAGYWLVLLMFLPAVLDVLRLQGLLTPVQEMFNKVLGFLPNIVSAFIIGAVGWLVARIIQRLVSNALAGLGTDRLSARIGLSKALGDLTLSTLLGYIAYVLVLIPVAIGALNALQLEAITRPASSMLETFFAAIPAIFGAALVLAIAYAAGRLLANVVSKLLNGIGFDTVLTKIGFARNQIGSRNPSELVGGLVLIAVLYLGVLESARLLGLATVAQLASDVAVIAGHVLFGLVIFGFGLFLGKVAGDSVQHSDISQARTLGIATRVAVVVLASGIALRQMGIANEIIELAFGLTLGAIAVAVALAFGLGGREAASRALEDMRSRLDRERRLEGRTARGGEQAAAR